LSQIILKYIILEECYEEDVYVQNDARYIDEGDYLEDRCHDETAAYADKENEEVDDKDVRLALLIII